MVGIVDRVTMMLVIMHLTGAWIILTAGKPGPAALAAVSAALHVGVSLMFQLALTGQYELRVVTTVAENTHETLALTGGVIVLAAAGAAERPILHSTQWAAGMTILAVAALTTTSLTGTLAGASTAAVASARAAVIGTHLWGAIKSSKTGAHPPVLLATSAGADAALAAAGIAAALT